MLVLMHDSKSLDTCKLQSLSISFESGYAIRLHMVPNSMVTSQFTQFSAFNVKNMLRATYEVQIKLYICMYVCIYIVSRPKKVIM